MRKRELGNSGLLVSELGLGCMSLPTNITEAEYVIDAAFEAGITFFDTADLYDGGINEELVGQALKNKRQDIVLATKVGNKMNPDGKTWHWDPSKKHIMEGVKASLSRMGTDYIDLYQLHGGTIEDSADETIEAFEQLKKEGVIRQYGISSIRPNVIERFVTTSESASVMMQYNMLDRRPEEWFSLINEHNASVIARGPLAKGLLTADGVNRAEKTASFVNYSHQELTKTIGQLAEQAENLHAAAIHFCLKTESVASALVGARNRKQLADSISAYETEVRPEQMQALETLLSLHHYNEHRV